ncbi:MAG TPA: ATP phosphoribosyltransferase, partial [Hyphomonas atlantica]|nr:ATP phosphoribosyltransferase [Hyphomonas atlantica]
MSVLSLAIPSKGRLKEKSEAFLMEQGFEVRQIGGERGYQAEITGLGEVDMRLLSAREIAQGIIDGTIHAGVTGEDLLHDLAPTGPEDFHVAERLGFGGADVIVAVPQAWIDVDTMSDLEAAGAAFRKAHHRRLRVATKYMRL